MRELPSELAEAVEAIVASSGMTGAAARELRDDLRNHARDALEAGRDPGEVRRLLGTAEDVGPVLERSSPPPPRRPDPAARESLVSALVTDLAYGLRTLRRAPITALAVVVVLALGIGANTVVFTVVNEILLRPLPVEDQESLVDVWARVPGGNSFSGFGWRDFEAYRDAPGPLGSLAAFAGTRLTLGEGDGARPVVGQLVSPGYMPLMGLNPALGTLEMETGGGFGSEPTAVLSHALWVDRFGSDPGVVGGRLLLDGTPVTIVGVAPRGFRGHFIGFPIDLWLPLTAADPLLPGFDPDDPGRMPFEMIGRLRGDATPEAAEAALNAVARTLEAEHPETHRGHRVGVTPTTGLDHSLQGPVRAFVLILTVVSGLILVIACLNVGSILLARTMSRESEMAVRLAMGAGNGRLVRQMLAESTIVTLAGAGVGVVGAVALNDVLADLLRSLTAGLGLELGIDGRVLLLTAAAALVAATLAAATPALHLARKEPASALRARGGGRRGARARMVLVVGQVAVSVMLLIGTGLFVRALARGLSENPGFDADRVATFGVEAGRGVAAPLGRIAPLIRELALLPGVEAVSLADGAPVGVARTPLRFTLPGRAPPPEDDAWVVDGRRVGAGYLSTVGIPLRAGRDFVEADAREGPAVAVVSRAFVQRFWPGRDDVVGRSLTVEGSEVRIVGVASDVRYLVQDENPDPFVYVSLAGDIPEVVRVTVRGPSPGALTDDVRRLVAEILPEHPAPVLSTSRETLDAALLPQRLGAGLVGAMGLAALLLSVVGLYGLVQYTVRRDRKALAIRVALGGSGGTVLGLVMRRGFLLVAVGVFTGVGAAVVAAPALSGFLGGVSPTDPLTYSVVVLTFCAVGLLASWLPARRAARIEPGEVLKGG